MVKDTGPPCALDLASVIEALRIAGPWLVLNAKQVAGNRHLTEVKSGSSSTLLGQCAIGRRRVAPIARILARKARRLWINRNRAGGVDLALTSVVARPRLAADDVYSDQSCQQNRSPQ